MKTHHFIFIHVKKSTVKNIKSTVKNIKQMEWGGDFQETYVLKGKIIWQTQDAH